MPIRALLSTLAAGALIVASAGALAANATTRQASVALDSPAPPWAQPTEAPAQARPCWHRSSSSTHAATRPPASARRWSAWKHAPAPMTA